MATHSSILAWEIPWTEEPGRLPLGAPGSTWLGQPPRSLGGSGPLGTFIKLLTGADQVADRYLSSG